VAGPCTTQHDPGRAGSAPRPAPAAEVPPPPRAAPPGGHHGGFPTTGPRPRASAIVAAWTSSPTNRVFFMVTGSFRM